MPYTPPAYLDLADAGTIGLESAQDRYKEARAALTRETERRDNYSGNNPNKFRGDVKQAAAYVDRWAYTIVHFYKGELPTKQPTGAK